MARAGLSAERLTQAAAELADEVGVEQVTLSALARRFGVAVPSLYSHVPSSAELRTRITLLALDELADRTTDAVAGRAGRDALVALGGVYRDYAREHPGRYDAARRPLDPERAAGSGGVRQARTTRAILREYRLGEPDETHAVRLLGSLFHGFVSLELAGGFSHSAPDSQATWERLLDGADALLRGWSDPTS